MVKYFKSTLSLILAFIITLSVGSFGLQINASAYYKDNFGDFGLFANCSISADGNYIYKKGEKDGEAEFVGSLEENITVLTIPDEIDGLKVTEVNHITTSSKAVTKIIYSKNIKSSALNPIGYYDKKNDIVYNYKLYDENTSVAPVINICLNEGLETLKTSHGDMNEAPVRPKILVLPTTLKEIENTGIEQNNIEAIVIQSDVNAKTEAFNHGCYLHGEMYATIHSTNVTLEYEPLSVYYTGDCLNASPLAFCCYSYPDSTPDEGPWLTVPDNFTIYKKSDAKGFEKFKSPEFDNYYAEEQYGVHRSGFTVKTYENEWWKDIKEVETITISAKNIVADDSLKSNLSADEKEYVSNTYTLSTTGNSVKISAKVTPTDAYDARVFYVSLNEDVAKVDRETGKVKIVGDGQAIIRCVSASGVFSDCVINSNRSTLAKIASAIQNFFNSLATKINTFFTSIFKKKVY